MSDTKTEAPKSTIDSDAVARAATARAEKLEKQVEALKAKLDERAKATPATSAEAELRSELERMKSKYDDLMNRIDAAADVRASAKREPKPLEEKYKGTKSYRSSMPHYRAGEFYPPGRIITVTDERPSKHWTLVEKRAVATEFVDVEPVSTEPAGRAADQQV